MAARGLGNSYGERTEFDPNRSVTREALPQSLASRLHYQEKKSSQDVINMPEEEWEPLSRGGLASREDVVDYLRAYEHYSV